MTERQMHMLGFASLVGCLHPRAAWFALLVICLSEFQ